MERFVLLALRIQEKNHIHALLDAIKAHKTNEEPLILVSIYSRSEDSKEFALLLLELKIIDPNFLSLCLLDLEACVATIYKSGGTMEEAIAAIAGQIVPLYEDFYGISIPIETFRFEDCRRNPAESSLPFCN